LPMSPASPGWARTPPEEPAEQRFEGRAIKIRGAPLFRNWEIIMHFQAEWSRFTQRNAAI
jgi:hypothetical protein